MNVKHAQIRFFDALNDFLSTSDRNKTISVSFKGRQSVKHIIESIGVPHPEVDKIIVNGELVNSSLILQNNDVVEVYPWYPHNDLYEKYNFKPRFILDNHLGKLATYLRILGIDTLYQNDFQDDEIVSIITSDERILLTRDRRLLMRREVNFGYCVRQDNPKKQLIEVVGKFNLDLLISPLKRCLNCNHKLIPIDKSSVIHRLEPLTKLYYEEFHKCPECDQVYWKGSHYKNMLELIHQVKDSVKIN